MKSKIAKHLLQIKAVSLKPDEPFTWASGIKSPIYCDNRLTLSYPEVRHDIAEGLKDLILTHFKGAEVVAGTATAGIPHAALAADRLNIPMCYVRSKPKAHGKGNQIEGAVSKGQKVIVVEDLISTGGSVLEVVAALQAEGCEVLGVAAIFTYGLPKAAAAFQEKNIPYVTLTDYDTLTDVALELKAIEPSAMNKLKRWRQDPSSESWMEETV
ncbi:orotate phosphoribosyltransferase [Bacillus safensis]|uniref:orotate phosphoribosyltransferase n=1 Tax=Bacillus safensis TaxID=561879 RepID=UPI000909C942|nr:orotate phosphoribosyltransferase [Bacillus safensis]APJ10815.1 orotate phosphoribosyltransferase [Bacillus safensis]MCY7473284.1 orotate phosphoribosyltransferase [Bacillus safensis]MCY7481868.1 orotate phosphoribosyltransferase [Bacillus safensis]MCY7511674.1 orotate phosphoribosyltransferase [Bacillus safensis]MCY7543460.1 orotate phosphoribosyltransferase [Bacillus safensis]